MTYDVLGAKALNYAPCRYGNSRILFRGPRRRLDVPYVAFIGGTQTYGKFIRTPFPALVESDLGVNCINFGICNAGVDVFVDDGFLLDAANGAVATVFQVVGAHNLSNRFYSVHPKRNDRFLKASSMLSTLFPEVDFSEFHFTRHMLNALYGVSPERFEVVRHELQMAWMSRMRLILRRIHGMVVLLWFSDHAPVDEGKDRANPDTCTEPLFVTRNMLTDLQGHTGVYVEVIASRSARAAGTQGMIFDEMEAMAARQMMGPQAHGEAALHLGSVLKSMV